MRARRTLSRETVFDPPNIGIRLRPGSPSNSGTPPVSPRIPGASSSPRSPSFSGMINRGMNGAVAPKRSYIGSGTSINRLFGWRHVLVTISVVLLLAVLHNIVSMQLASRCVRPGGTGATGSATDGSIDLPGGGNAHRLSLLPFFSSSRLGVASWIMRNTQRQRTPAPGFGATPDPILFGSKHSAGSGDPSDGVLHPATSVADAELTSITSFVAAQRLSSLLAPSNVALMKSISDRAATDARSQVRALAVALAQAVKNRHDKKSDLMVVPPVDASVPTDRFTTQTCYVQTDESEICTYEGAMCYDGEGVVVSLDEYSLSTAAADATAGEEGLTPPFANSPARCMDARYDEPTSAEYDGGCESPRGSARTRFDAITRDKDGGNARKALPVRQPADDSPLVRGKRGWGPLNPGGGARFRGIPSSSLFGSGDSANGEGTTTAEKQTVSGAAGLRIARQTRVGSRVIDWLPESEALWFVSLDAGASENEFAWWNRVGVLFDALRNNASDWDIPSNEELAKKQQEQEKNEKGSRMKSSTSYDPASGTRIGAHPKDGYIHWIKRWQLAAVQAIYMNPPTSAAAVFRINSQWPLPPMSAVLLGGEGGDELTEGVNSLREFQQYTLSLATPPGTRVVTSGALQNNKGGSSKAYSSQHLLCARRGAVVGHKPKIFTGRADGWLFRQYAYTITGIAAQGARSHPRYVPRQVTFLNIGGGGAMGPGVANVDDVIAAIHDIGIPYSVVDTETFASLSFKDRVSLMAATGILVAPHASALVAAAALPAHSVLIELFGIGVRRTHFKYMAETTDVHYYPVFGSVTPPCGENPDADWAKALHSPEFAAQCTAKNTTSYDNALLPVCRAARDSSPIVVPLTMLNQVLYDAVDTISAFSLRNPAWFDIANTTGAIANIPPFKEIQWQRFRKY